MPQKKIIAQKTKYSKKALPLQKTKPKTNHAILKTLYYEKRD